MPGSVVEGVAAVCGRSREYDEGISAQHLPRISLEEFLELEATAERKSEYLEGQVFPMAGATYEQAVIAANLVGALGKRLRGEDCRVIGSGLLVEAAEDGLVTYPAALVICGVPQFVGPTRLVVSNSVLVVDLFQAGGRWGIGRIGRCSSTFW